MRFSQLRSFSLAVTFAAQALPQALAASPLGAALAASAFAEGQTLYVSDGIHYANNTFQFIQQFASLDLSTSWTSDAPAWKNLTRRQTQQNETQGTIALIKNDTSLLFFSNLTINKYNPKSGEWTQDLKMNWTYQAFSGGAVTDTDSGLIYGIESKSGGQNNTLRFTELDLTNKRFTYVDVQGGPDPAAWTAMVYSSSAKAIFGYEEAVSANKSSALWTYSTASKKWSKVVGTT